MKYLAAYCLAALSGKKIVGKKKPFNFIHAFSSQGRHC